jgi:hypothetical protein
MTEAGKHIKELSLAETQGLCICILRDEMQYKWDYIAVVMNMSRQKCDRLYKKFNQIYLCTENGKVIEEGENAPENALAGFTL